MSIGRMPDNRVNLRHLKSPGFCLFCSTVNCGRPKHGTASKINKLCCSDLTGSSQIVIIHTQTWKSVDQICVCTPAADGKMNIWKPHAKPQCSSYKIVNPCEAGMASRVLPKAVVNPQSCLTSPVHSEIL